ncbi:MAG: aminopeptidase [Theionarchaea archaeon]|nr:aminopeptidase [Theionarchaea archaeon]MBU7038528.1 aminopeptidase [Theionarchaea archaeon]
MDELVLKAGRTIVETCSRLMPSEKATIITDRETHVIGQTVERFAQEVATKVKVHILEDYAERPLTFLPEEIKEDIKTTDVTYFCAQAQPGELKDFRRPLINLAISVGRQIHMPGIDLKIMRTGMQADYYKIASLTYLVTGIASKSKTARVTTPGGTDLVATFSRKLKWIPDTGLLWHRGMFGNLPAGEAYTCPEKIEGTMVVDGILGDFFNQKYGSLDKTPVTLSLKDSRADFDTLTCENTDLLKEFKEYLRQDINADRVGEFAVGTNISLKEVVTNLLQDEKFPGVHIAFGFPYPHETGADWESAGHVDGILRKCSVWFDDTQIMEDGRFMEKEILDLK